MAPSVVYENATPASGTAIGTLFVGKTFWVSRRTPMRLTYVDRITSNGGEVIENEKSADYKIADHVKMKFAPQGSVSYKFIDACLETSELVEIAPHLIFPSTQQPRSIGSVQRPAKRQRVAFTAEDDRILAEWVAKYDSGQHGNVIFQELEQQHPNHTWQSWRDHHVKRRVPKSPGLPVPAPPSDSTGEQNATTSAVAPTSTEAQEQPAEEKNDVPAKYEEREDSNVVRNGPSISQGGDSRPAPVINGTDDGEESETVRVDAPYPPISGLVAEDDEESDDNAVDEPDRDDPGDRESMPAFAEEDFEALLNASKTILSMETNRVDEAWAAFAQQDSFGRTGEQWRSYWEEVVLPVYLQQKKRRQRDGVPSPEAVSPSPDTEEESDSSSSDSQNASAPGTPHRAEVEGIEILADDGKRHLSTPIRTKSSPSEKRKYPNEIDDTGPPSPLGERSPLKKRRLGSNVSQPKSPSMVEDSETGEVSTQAQGFHTAPTGKVELGSTPVVDLSQMSDGHSKTENSSSSSSSSSAAFEDSALFETAPAAPRDDAHHVESSEDVDLAQLDTQGYIDAQLMSEMGSAAKPASPPAGRRPRPPSSGAARSSRAQVEAESSYSDGEESEESADFDASVVTKRGSSVRFAPAAFQTSPSIKPPPPSSAHPVLLPPFSEPRSAKARGKQRQMPSPHSSPAAGTDTVPRTEDALQETSGSEALPSDIPAWVRLHIARGHSIAHLQTAVKAASGELDLAEQVLHALAQGHPVPDNVRGIWTDKDDIALRQGYESVLIPVLKKHGKKALDERLEFLHAFED